MLLTGECLVSQRRVCERFIFFTNSPEEYTLRLCLSAGRDNFILFSRKAHYDPKSYFQRVRALGPCILYRTCNAVGELDLKPDIH